MNQLSPPFRLRRLLSASALCLAFTPAVFAASLPRTAPAPSLVATILEQDDSPTVSMCPLGDEPRASLLSKLATSLTVASRNLAEPGFVQLDDYSEPGATSDDALPAPAAALARVRSAPALAAAPTRVDTPKASKLDYLKHLPADLASQAKVLSAHITAKFNVAPDNANKIVGAAMKTASQTGLPPTLLLAVMAVESGFNHMAKNGNARGLMQIIPFWHKEKVKAVGGQQELMKVEKNIAAGSAILKEYVDRNGSVQQGLVRYNASAKATEYSAKVLKQKNRFEALLPEQ